MPNTAVEPLPSAMLEVANDQYMAMYVASLGRSVLSLHGLLANKITNKDAEAAAAAPEEKKAEGDAAAGGDKKGEEKGKGDEKGAAAKKS